MLSTVCYAPDTSDNNPSWKSPQQQKSYKGLHELSSIKKV